MASNVTQTLTLPTHPLADRLRPGEHWSEHWQNHVDTLLTVLGPRQGIHRLHIDREAQTLTIEYDPEHFSIDQLRTLARQIGLVVGGAVHHAVLNLPSASRTAPAAEIENRLRQLPGVSYAAVNPMAHTIVVEYPDDASIDTSDIMQQLRAWGYRVRERRLPEGWWERNRLIIYTAVAGSSLLAAWLTENAGAPSWLWGALYVLAYLAGGGFAARNGWVALRQLRIDVDTLMVVAALGAAIIGEYVEGGILLFLFALSNALEHVAMDRTRQAIRALMDLRPATARVKRGVGKESVVAVEELEIGDVIVVRPGERLAADGEVVAGQSGVDQSSITGESIPVSRGIGDNVFAGSINGSGALDVRVTKRAQDSTLARIILLVEEAQSERAPTQKRLDRFEQKYAVGVIAFAASIAIILPTLLGWTWNDAFYKSMTLLVVASPCALVISTPASILSAIAAGARNSVLFKGGAHIENLARVRVVAFDKTGTLTEGKPRVTDIVPDADYDDNQLLALAAAVEARSEHPLAQAVVTAAQQRGLSLHEATDLQSTAGKGVSADVDGRSVLIGTRKHLHSHGHSLPADALRIAEEMQSQGKTVIFVGDVENNAARYLGLLAVSDTVRPEAAQALRDLKASGIEKLVMLTGDNPRAAKAIAKIVGVDEVRAELLPEEKVAEVKRLMADYGNVAMVGDGVNDAPALVLASVGIAMGAGGTDVALETADVVLMASDLSKLPYAINLSRRAARIVTQNLTFALAVIVTLIVSSFLNVISLPLGVVGHEGSTVIVVLNGLRLLRYKGKS